MFSLLLDRGKRKWIGVPEEAVSNQRAVVGFV
jgi:hypothetical protein